MQYAGWPNISRHMATKVGFFRDLRWAGRRVALLAEAVRFELTNGCPLPVFKTGAIDHSATLPMACMIP